ncbi:hypothetical protein pEaSNUABM8_00130 [Erwinia phage pEa_SNUABM_8]|nr:hypothetical protein pEaSNUABM8_00130 [Erwinia phage pEa_SNUABM_8]QVW54882.1 hypothetical protein pEaSNUABM4_00129 [Erwinia phage pEa_SNUABM_4]
MREITEEVVKGNYPKPLGRGLLKWRIDDLDTERGETKHIVELDNGDIAYVRKLANSLLVTDIDILYGLTGATLVGLPECLGAQHAFLYSSKIDDPMPKQLGMALRTVTMRKDGQYEMDCPEGFEVDVVLSDAEMAALLSGAETSEGLRLAIGDIGRGISFLCRVKSQLGDALLIVDRDPDNGLTLNCFTAAGTQDVLRILDGFDYLVSKAPYGYYNAVHDHEVEVDLADYMASKGFKPKTSVFAVTAAPKGE